ncbi:MAG: ATP-dependent Clp protease ATP-binding subunit ClpC [candidate division SR1 bacterium CG_4_9_14_3_um_filter_40_9]|nr:MAG: ATP-dependent Clp protease ATP-binding subunit ClpC [candidate division SR1 bacterium CG_4_9_14_3_um_filter_40_9]
MYKEAKLTAQATSCLTYAHTFATKKNHPTITGDDLFAGIYFFIKETPYEDIFFNLLGIENHELLQNFFEERYINTQNTKTEEQKNLIGLTFSDSIHIQIHEFVNKSSQQLDFIVLLYASLSDLSSDLEGYFQECQLNVEKLKKNCRNIIQNTLVHQIGLFAFLEILNKLFTRLHLDSKNVKMLKIQNIKTLDNLNMFLDAVDSEIADKNDTSVIDTAKTNKKEEKKMTIEYFGADLTKEVKDGFIDPIIGRENEINQMIYTLLRKNKNNPLLIGEAGVGKTAIVEGLAQKINQGLVPDKLKNKRIFLLDMGTLVAGTKYRGEFESRMKSILEEAMDPTNNIIMFIDEIHTIIGAGGQENNDAAQMIKPLLSRGKIKLIGATTFNEYQKYIEKDAALKRRFQEVIVNEPNNEMSKEILLGLKQTYEDFHGVQIADAALEAAVTLSKRYMLNKYLPDKALDLIDEACAKKSTMSEKLNNDEEYKKFELKINKIEKQIEEAIEKQDYFGAAEFKEQEDKMKQEMLKIRSNKNIPTHLRMIISKEDIGNVLADKIGVPTNIVNESEIEKLNRLSVDLKTKIMGQDEAVNAVVKTLTRSRISVMHKAKPIGSFLFLGPSGVGKTYLAKLIAKDYFGDETAMIRIDMSEFMEKYSVSKLIGSPAGYVGYDEGGNLTEAIRRKPYCVLLLDEVEKAATDVLNILLQILDEGQLKDAKGRLIDFKNIIIIMTSNIGNEEFGKKQSKIGFATGDKKDMDNKQFELIKERVIEELKNFLSPELLNRIDYKIIFKHLGKKDLGTILKLKIKDLMTAWKTNETVKLPTFSEKKIQEIIEKIYEPQFGARPLERYIENTIEPKLIKQIMKKGK